jgi:hypothetical protein
LTETGKTRFGGIQKSGRFEGGWWGNSFELAMKLGRDLNRHEKGLDASG